MRIFEHGNWSGGDKCLVCQTAEDKPVTLIGVAGTEDDGNIIAKQVHIDCLNLYYLPEQNVFLQRVPDWEK